MQKKKGTQSSKDYNGTEIVQSTREKFTADFKTLIAPKVLKELYKKLKSIYRTNPKMYFLSHKTNSMSEIWLKSFKRLKKTMIVVPGSIEAANEVSDYFNKQIGKEFVAMSHSDNDQDSLIIEEFKTNKKLILIVVHRANIGYNFPDLVNLIDMSFSMNIDRIYQMLCRVNRISSRNEKKLFLKVVPNNVYAYYMEHIITCVLCLMDIRWLSIYNGKNFNNKIKIPVKKE